MKKIVILGLVILTLTSMVGCTSWERFNKNVESNTKGLHRIVKVISVDGSVVEQYESKSMIVTDGDGGTITLDFDGKRVTICNAQVIIEEVK